MQNLNGEWNFSFFFKVPLQNNTSDTPRSPKAVIYCLTSVSSNTSKQQLGLHDKASANKRERELDVKKNKKRSEMNKA